MNPKIKELLAWLIEESEELYSVYSWKNNTTDRNNKEQVDRKAKIAEARAALALCDEEPTVSEDALRQLYNMAALNGRIPNNRDEIIKVHMAEYGYKVCDMNYTERNRLFDLRCRSKRGEYLSPDDRKFCEEMFKLYPEEYAADERRVFIEPAPFGSREFKE